VEKWHASVKYSYSSNIHAEHYDVQDVIKEIGLQPGFSKIGDPRFLLR
jgi:mannosyl-oligosaccharide alpha-1,2-mannosidase